MNSMLPFGLLLLAACTGATELGSQDASPRDPLLTYRLVAREAYAVDGPVTVGFVLENVSEETLWVLTWYTPLEGIKGKIFSVTRDGEGIAYEGRMVKRGDPLAEEYVRVEAGESVSAEVDLAEAYDLSRPGEYRVEFNGRIHDVLREDRAPRARDEHRGVDADGEAVTFRVEAS